MGDVSAWLLIGPVIAMGMMTFSGMNMLEKYRALLFEHGELRREVEELRRRNLAGKNWQEMLPFAFDDATQVIVVSDRVPTDQDKLDTDVPIIWMSLEHQRTWAAVLDTPGHWNEQTFRDPEGYNHFFAITARDQFLYVHTCEYEGLARLVNAMSEADGDRIDDPALVKIAVETPNVISRLMDSAGGDGCSLWDDMVKGSGQGRIPPRRTVNEPRARPINLD